MVFGGLWTERKAMKEGEEMRLLISHRASGTACLHVGFFLPKMTY